MCGLGQLALVAFEGCLVGPQDPFGPLCFLKWSMVMLVESFCTWICSIRNLLYLSETKMKGKAWILGPTTGHWTEHRPFYCPLIHRHDLISYKRAYFSLSEYFPRLLTLLPPLPIFSLDWMFEEDQQTGSNGATHAWKQGCLWMWVNKVWFYLVQFGLVWLSLVLFGEPICWLVICLFYTNRCLVGLEWWIQVICLGLIGETLIPNVYFIAPLYV